MSDEIDGLTRKIAQLEDELFSKQGVIDAVDRALDEAGIVHASRALGIKELNRRLVEAQREIKSFKMQGQPADPVKLVEALEMMKWNKELRDRVKELETTIKILHQ